MDLSDVDGKIEQKQNGARQVNAENRTIFEADNLPILRGLDSEACNSTKGNRTQDELI